MKRSQLNECKCVIMWAFLTFSVGPLCAQTKTDADEQAISALTSEDVHERYSALSQLRFTGEISEPVLMRLIDCLDDLRGEPLGNTIAGEAAEILAEHPRQARRAIPQLLKLLCYRERYGGPSGSAAKALESFERPALEKYLNGLDAVHRKGLVKDLGQVLGAEAGTFTGWALVAEIMGMLVPEATNAVPIIEEKLALAKNAEEQNPHARVLSARCESSLRMIKKGWKPGDAGYFGEIRPVDASLGKQDQYVLPENRFANALGTLIQKMEEANVGKAYILRKEEMFPFCLSEGLPLAELIQNDGYRYLGGGGDGKWGRLPNVPLILLTKASKEIYRSSHSPGARPPYSPLVSDFAFIDLGINGLKPLDQSLKTVGIREGYSEALLYEYWPAEWWPGKGELLGEFRSSKNFKTVWISVVGGHVIGATTVENESGDITVTPDSAPTPASSRTGATVDQAESVAGATKETPFVNSLGMKFVPVPGTNVLLSIWETRVKDFEAFVKAAGHKAEGGMYSWNNPGFAQTGEHAVCRVSWEDATAFCEWLTGKERKAGRISARQSYRLPTDEEWSVAVGLEKESGSTPEQRTGKVKGVYPWGTKWPPPKGAGNYDAGLGVDDYEEISPVGSFEANGNGIYDLGGNVWEWCEDRWSAEKEYRALRGASRGINSPAALLSSYRYSDTPELRGDNYGFRCVLVVDSSREADRQRLAAPSKRAATPGDSE